MPMTVSLRRWWRRWLAIACCGLMAIALPACSLENFKNQDTAQVPQVVGITTIEPKTFNFVLSQQSPNVFGFLYEGLITEDAQGAIVPAQAESWEVSDDNLRIRFRLREGLKWSDGEPLTADDVVFTYDQVYLNPDIPTDARDVLRIGVSGQLPSVRKISDREVEFTTPEPFAPFLRITGFPILPQHSLEPLVTQKEPDGRPKFVTALGIDTPPQDIIVNGPYTIERYITNQRVVFRRNPHYWQRDDQGNPLPSIERFVWQIVESPETGLLQFRAGGLDLLNIGVASFALLKQEEKRSNFTIYNGGPDSGTTFISFNLNKGSRNGKPLIDPIKSRWFNTVEFRQAVAYAIDREKMINNTLRGLGQPQDSPISVQSPYYLSREEGLKVYDHNPEKARQLLQSVGFRYDAANQLLDQDGNRVRFTLLAPTGGRLGDSIGSQIRQDLGKIGMQVDFQPIDFGTLVEKITNSLDWECHFLAFTGGVEPNNGFNIWSPDGGLHSFNQKPLPGQPPVEGREVYDWEARIGELYIQGARELDEAKRKAIYAETQQLAQEYLPYIHLVNGYALAAVKNRLQNVEMSPLQSSVYQILWNAPLLRLVEQSALKAELRAE